MFVCGFSSHGICCRDIRVSEIFEIFEYQRYSSITRQNAGGPGFIIQIFIMLLTIKYVFTKILLLFYVMLVMTRGRWYKRDRGNFWRTNTVGRESQILRAMNSTRVMGTISHKRRMVKSKTLNWCG